MAPEIPVGEPVALTAGETWRWKVVAPDFPHADGWELTYYLIGPSGGTISTSADANPTTYLAEMDAASSADVAAGTYQWVLRAAGVGSDVFQVDHGVFVVQPDPTSAAEESPFEERMVAAIETVLLGRVPSDVQEYQIHGRALTKIPVRELKKLHAEYKYALWKIQNPGKPYPDRKVVFSNA